MGFLHTIGLEGDYYIPHIADQWPCIPFMFVLIGIRVLMLNTLSQGCAQGLLKKDRKNDPKKIERLIVMLFKFGYYAVLAPYQYMALKDADFLPPAMFGAGEMTPANMLPGGPEQPESGLSNQLQPPGIRLMYIFALAYHTHSLVYQFRYMDRHDFLTMTSHHIITLLLVAGSYHFNFVRWGALVMLSHDGSDFFCYMDKSLVDTPYQTLNASVHCCVVFIWAYCRLYFYPVYVIYNAYMWTQVGPREDLWMSGLPFVVLMSMLLCLHIYWEYLLVKILYDVLFNAKYEDPLTKYHSPESKREQLQKESKERGLKND